MKKINILLITLLMLFISISNVNAMTLKPSGASSGKRGEEITLYVTLERSNSEKQVSAVDGTLSYDSNVLELISSINLMTNWTTFASISNGSAFGYGNLSFDNLISTTSQNIVKMVFKINSNASYGNTTVSIKSPSATDEVGDAISISGGTHNVKVLSDVNTLSNLIISNGTINFDENTTEYSLTIDSNNTSISATKKDETSSISGDNGTKSLNYGLNTFKITVTSESGLTKVYTLNITRPDNRSKTNTLSSLKLSNGTIKFDKNTTSYNVTVENNITSTKIEASLTDNKSSFVEDYGPRTANLNVGSNKIEIKVKAENEEVKIYTINITRKDVDRPVNNAPEENKKSNNNYLSELKLSNGTLVFNKEITEYKVTVSYNIKELELNIKTEDEKATFELEGNEELKVGENIVTIKVKAEDESIKEYKIIVIRKEKDEALSSNSKLKSLTISGYQINFNSNTFEYNIKIKGEDNLKITYTEDDTKSNVTITGNQNIKNGSIITITVVAEDGTTSKYKINIEKDNKNNIIILSSIAILTALVIILTIWLIIARKNINTNNH